MYRQVFFLAGGAGCGPDPRRQAGQNLWRAAVLVDHPPGAERAQVVSHGAPLIRASRQEVADAGIEFTPRVAGIQSGKPQLEDGRILPVEGVIWATGFRPDYSWVNLPVFDAQGYPRHQRGVVREAPGLFFIGLPFQTALSSALLGGVGEDAKDIARQIPPAHPSR